jgi:hypothetical protein
VDHRDGCGAQQRLQPGERLQRGRRQRERRIGPRQCSDEGQETPQVRQRHHRQAVAHQGVVGIVPLRPLGVQPQATAGQQAAGLGQHDGGELLAQRGQHRQAVVVADPQAVGADRLRPGWARWWASWSK